MSASKRDAIQQLKEEAANGEFDILLVYMFDRLGRIESETPFVLEWFVQHGIQMWSTHEGQQKIETHGDKLMNYISFWQAAASAKKYNLSITAFSAVSGTKAAETVTGKHCTLPREWMPSS